MKVGEEKLLVNRVEVVFLRDDESEIRDVVEM